jgi:hypothetical protein
MKTMSLLTMLVMPVMLAACQPPQSRWMIERSNSEALRPPAGKALLVVLRPEKNPDLRMTLFDEAGRFLGQPIAKSHYGVVIDPGERMLFVQAGYALGLSVKAAKLNLAADKTYFVFVGYRKGAFSKKLDIMPLNSRSKEWAKLSEWMSRTKRYEADLRGGQRHLEENPEDLQKKLSMGWETWNQLSGEERQARTSRAEDGV